MKTQLTFSSNSLEQKQLNIDLMRQILQQRAVISNPFIS